MARYSFYVLKWLHLCEMSAFVQFFFFTLSDLEIIFGSQ
jgi:hypothetical protein